MELLHEEFKILSIKNYLSLDQTEKKEIKDIIDLNFELKHKPVFTKDGPFNFSITEGDTSFFDHLYQKYLDTCHDIFDEFHLSDENKRLCWVYRGNKIDMGERRRSWWHHHARTASISAVYYLEVFRDGITFTNGYKEFDYIPENGELIIHPADLIHAAHPCRLLDYRYSVNMEIRTEEPFKELFKYGFSKRDC